MAWNYGEFFAVNGEITCPGEGFTGLLEPYAWISVRAALSGDLGSL